MSTVVRTGIRLRRMRRGVSLIEAVVALAVMAFGMLGVVGMQTSLRSNADVAKQRAEAVRTAQAGIEEWRGFSVLAANPLLTDYADIATDGPTNFVGVNATYIRNRTVTASADPRIKTLVADVAWTDRAGLTQSVRLSTHISGIAPELAASLAIRPSGSPSREPLGRNRAIPVQARDFGDGWSGLKPSPDALSPVAWRFDNITGIITLCTTAEVSTSSLTQANISCGTQSARILAGYLRYALGPTQPTLIDAQTPPSVFPVVPFLTADIQVSVDQSSPFTGSVACFKSPAHPVANTYHEYLCAVPVDANALTWSGTVRLTPAPPLVSVADTSVSSSQLRACRYFDTSAVFASGSYLNVGAGLSNQNYLFILAGNGTTAFTCPTGGAAPTWPQQP